MVNKQLILEALSLPITATTYYVTQRLAEFYPDKALIEGNDCSFNLEAYAKAGNCTIEPLELIQNQITTGWDRWEEVVRHGISNGYFRVRWQEYTVNVLLMSWEEKYFRTQYYWILADTKEVARNFFANVSDWREEIEEEVLVFEEGYWSTSAELFDAIKSTTFDNLVLGDNLSQEIQYDLTNFFASQEIYQAYGLPWKRGILFIGPPGNGKTHALKASINKMQKPCLYVKSFQGGYYSDENKNIRQVFGKARLSAPCILVLEDIDSLMNAQNRSFFLNELDGFSLNQGIITIATTNYPERLDPAIIDRPSRFDRKYYFGLPGSQERLAYIKLWNKRLQARVNLSQEAVNQITELTNGFSFAYLQELLRSSTIEWIGMNESGELEAIIIKQAALLRKQMTTQ